VPYGKAERWPDFVEKQMKLHLLSDLHFEFDRDWLAPSVEADVLVLAGDIEPGTAGLARFAEHAGPIIYVPGNHEYYGGQLDAVNVELRDAANSSGIHLLDNDELVLDGVRFLGSTLWTDFRLDGEEVVAQAFAAARKYVTDFRCIRLSAREWLTPEDTVLLHEQAVRWLQAKLAEPFSGSTVVITHHAPHPKSVHARWKASPVNPAFASDLTRLMGRAPVWIHGHMHDSFDYTVQGTRIICNPKGYRTENKSFVPNFVVEIG
jgi:Icc-related predicted phosphoesterase